MGAEILVGVVVLGIGLPAIWIYNRLVADRARALQAPPGERFAIEKALGEKLGQVVVLQESYPQLKADAAFRDLAAQLVAVEDHLQYARRFYNGAVKQYRTRLESFPDVVVAKLFGFRPLPFFEP